MSSCCKARLVTGASAPADNGLALRSKQKRHRNIHYSVTPRCEYLLLGAALNPDRASANRPSFRAMTAPVPRMCLGFEFESARFSSRLHGFFRVTAIKETQMTGRLTPALVAGGFLLASTVFAFAQTNSPSSHSAPPKSGAAPTHSPPSSSTSSSSSTTTTTKSNTSH